jgi:L-iditol 2-dehydrogenase
MQALQYQGQRKVPLADVPVPKIGPGEVLLAVEVCGLCGSDILKIDSKLQPPVALGHEVGGIIEEVGEGVENFAVGDRVVVSHHVPCLACHYCLKGSESMCREFKRSNLDPGGFAQFMRASKRHVDHVMFKVPEHVPLIEAAMTEPLACCLRNVRRMDLRAGDVAAVVGLGFIGLMTAELLRVQGITVIGLDIDPARVKLAHKLGIERALTGKDGRTGDLLKDLTEGRGADAVIFTAGRPEMIPERFPWVRDGGIVNVFAGFKEPSTAVIDLDEIYHREISLMSSYSPALEDLAEAHRMICEGEFDVSQLTKHKFSLDRFDEALRKIRGREIVKAILLPQRNKHGKNT